MDLLLDRVAPARVFARLGQGAVRGGEEFVVGPGFVPGYAAALRVRCHRRSPFAELGVLLGVSRQRVTQLTGKGWFPAPVTRLAMGAVWELVDIERLVSGRGRELNYPALEAHLTAIQERHRTGPDDEAL